MKYTLIILFLCSCAMNRAPSMRLLEKRADFDGKYRLDSALSEIESPLLVPKRTVPVMADIWVHPHELPNGDYFRGAWIKTLITKPTWEMEQE